jgi:hypothetical protein
MIGKLMLVVGSTFVLTSSTATAQTRTFDGEITSGSIIFDVSDFSDDVEFDISGTGFRLIGSGGDFYNIAAGLICVSAPQPECVRGRTVPLTAVAIGDFFAEGMAIVNGETLSPAYYSGGFQLSGGTVTIPTKGNRKFLRLSAPFSITLEDAGQLRVFVNSSDRGLAVEPWAQGTLFGSGIATVYLEKARFEGQTYYVARRVVYNFGVQ